jgi:hypothetical protein
LLAPFLALFVDRQQKNIDTAEIKMRLAALKIGVVAEGRFAYLA